LERLGRTRLRFTDAERRRLARKARKSWGYTRIRGALANLGHQVGRGSIASILKENGIEPAPERDEHTRWSTFLKAHWECLTATDFLSVEVCTIKGLVTHYILFFIDIASRSVHVAGIIPNPADIDKHHGPIKRRQRLGGMLVHDRLAPQIAITLTTSFNA
jgi:putative transposase